MPTLDLDTLQEDRVKQIAKQARDTHDLSPSELFHSERVVETLTSEKVYLDSYRDERVYSTLPFAPVTYASLCKYCVSKDDFERFKSLVSSGLLIPILRNPYSWYPEPVSEFISSHDHISCYEYSFWKWYRARKETEYYICSNCTDKYVAEICEIVKGKRGAPAFREMVQEVRDNLLPYGYPDIELLDVMAEALEARDADLAIHLVGLSRTIKLIRSSQTVGAPLLIDNHDLEQLPPGIAEAVDNARDVSVDIRRQVAEGLGIKIPMNIPIDQYIEIAKEFQPRISEISRGITNDDSGLAQENLLRTIENLNREIERVKGLKRHVALEAGVSFFGNHKELIAGSVAASLLGLTAWGCAALAAGAGAKVARKKGLLKSTPELDRLGRMIVRDLQPLFDGVIAKYLETSPTTVAVMTMKKRIEKSRKSLPATSAA